MTSEKMRYLSLAVVNTIILRILSPAFSNLHSDFQAIVGIPILVKLDIH